MFNLQWSQIEPYFYPVLIILGSMVLGFIVEKILFSVIKKITKQHPKSKVDFATWTLKAFMMMLFFIAGVYASMDILPMNPSAVNKIKEFSVIILILSATVILAHITVGLIGAYSKKSGGADSSTSIITNLVRTIFYVLGFTVLLQTLGISITPILTALGIGGLAVALALQDTLTNFFAGLHIIASGQVKVGDYVRLDNGMEGYVTDIKWRDTTIRNLSNNMIIVPNSKLSSNIITNFYQPQKSLGIGVDMIVAMKSDLDKVETICLEVAGEVLKDVSGGDSESKPSVRFGAFTDNGIKFSVNMQIEEFTSQYIVKHEFIKRIISRFDKEGIIIPFPVREIIMKNTGSK